MSNIFRGSEGFFYCWLVWFWRGFCFNTRTYIYVYTHMHIYIYIYIYICTHGRVCGQFFPKAALTARSPIPGKPQPRCEQGWEPGCWSGEWGPGAAAPPGLRGEELLKQRHPLCLPKTCPAKLPSGWAVPEGITRGRFSSRSPPVPWVPSAPGSAGDGAMSAAQTFSLLKPSPDNPPEEKSAIRANLKEEEGEEGSE